MSQDVDFLTMPSGNTGPLLLQAARDTFARVTANGWGNANVGGPWSPASGFAASRFSTDGTRGVMSADSTAPVIGLPGLAAQDVDLLCRVTPLNWNGTDSIDQAIGVRWDGGTAWYQAGCFPQAGVYYLAVKTKPANVNLSGNVAIGGPGSGAFWVRLQCFGTNPTAIRAKAWYDTAPEPGAWTWVGSDSTAGLQQAGGIIAIAFNGTASYNCGFDRLDVAGLRSNGLGITANPPPSASLYAGRTNG